MLGVLSSAFNGESMLKGRSLFMNRAGEQVAAPQVQLVDDPTDPRMMGAAQYDGDGVPTRRNPLIVDGVLQGFLHNVYTGRRAGTGTTGSATRGFASTPGVGVRGRLRDAVLRTLTARAWRAGLKQRSAVRVEIGLPADDPGPLRRLVATLPALEVPRPDWPDEAVVVGPLHFEPTDTVLAIPPGDGPVIVVAPSTAKSGALGLAEVALEALRPGDVLPPGSRVVVSRLRGDDVDIPTWAVVGLGRQDELLAAADLVICGGGHGMVSKTLMAGVPMVVVPGGGDQWEIANRLVRQGSAQLIRPLEPNALAMAVTEVLSSPRYAEAARAAGATAADVEDPVRVCHDALAPSA